MKWQGGDGRMQAGGDTTHLVSTFGDIWRTHRGDMNLPPPKGQWNNTKSNGGATVSESSSSPYNNNNNRTPTSSRHMKAPNSAVRSSSSAAANVSERALHFVKSLPPSKQAPPATSQSRQSIRDDQLRHHRRSPGFYWINASSIFQCQCFSDIWCQCTGCCERDDSLVLCMSRLYSIHVE